MSTHLESAARTLQLILNRRDPEHSYIVSVREGDRDDSARLAAASARQAEIRAAGENPDAISDVDLPPTPGGANNDSGEKRA